MNDLPELLAPAGDPESLLAAVNHGADAVYLGLRRFSARARARNFGVDELAEYTAELRPRGVRVYVALNTLVLDREIRRVVRTIEEVVEAGADALILQDLGVARLARQICPEIALHASTQTSIGSAAACAHLRALGFRRLIAPRELSVERLGQLVRRTDLGIEAFVHGAHCISWSGQCTASLARGGRSSNRGECAQPCRLPYEVRTAGPRVDARRFPLSPTDLVGEAVVADLVRAGVRSLKIEGRLKRPEYVASAVHHYRLLLDRIGQGRGDRLTDSERRDLLQPFTRTSTTGYLTGTDHRALVEGNHPGNLGLLIGDLVAVRGRSLVVDRVQLEVLAGDGIGLVVSGGGEVVGGRVHGVDPAPGRGVALRMGPEFAIALARPGQQVWRTDNPRLIRRLRLGIEGRSREARPRRQPVIASVAGAPGAPLRLALEDNEGRRVEVASEVPLQHPRTRPLEPTGVRARLGKLGQTPYVLADLRWGVEGAVALPPVELNRLRRRACAELSALRGQPLRRVVRPPVEVTSGAAARPAPTGIYVLCRSVGQVSAATAGGAAVILCEPPAGAGMEPLLDAARRGGAAAFAALPRSVGEGDEAVAMVAVDLRPDGLLVRDLSELRLAAGIPRDRRPLLIADRSFGAVNALAVGELLDAGADIVSPGYDLPGDALAKLAATVGGDRLEVVASARLPLFHTAHCLFAANVAGAADLDRCGRICRRTSLALRDGEGRVLPVVADDLCRCTVFEPEIRVLPADLLAAARLPRLRIELLDESDAEVVERLEQLMRVLQSTDAPGTSRTQ